MTDNEFQNKYHAYMTTNAKEAILEADKVCKLGPRVVAVNLDGTWCLMLKTAVDALGVIGINPTAIGGRK